MILEKFLGNSLKKVTTVGESGEIPHFCYLGRVQGRLGHLGKGPEEWSVGLVLALRGEQNWFEPYTCRGVIKVVKVVNKLCKEWECCLRSDICCALITKLINWSFKDDLTSTGRLLIFMTSCWDKVMLWRSSAMWNCWMISMLACSVQQFLDRIHMGKESKFWLRTLPMLLNFSMNLDLKLI